MLAKVTLTLASVLSLAGVINYCEAADVSQETYTRSDGRLYYRDPYLCLPNKRTNVGAYAFLHKFYRVREYTDCCYLATSRNHCCFTVDIKAYLQSSRTECQCSPMAKCMPPPPTPAPTEAPTTLTEIITTMRETTAPTTEMDSTTMEETTSPTTEMDSTTMEETTSPTTEMDSTTMEETTSPTTEMDSTTMDETTSPTTEMDSTTMEETTSPTTEMDSTTMEETTSPTTEMDSTTMEETTSPTTEMDSTTMEETTSPTTEMDSTTMEETTSPTTEMDSTTMEETTSPTTEMDSTTMEETTSPKTEMNSTTMEETTSPTTEMNSTTMEETTSPKTEMNSTTMEETTSPTTEMDSTTMEETTSPKTEMNSTTMEETTSPTTEMNSTTMRETTSPTTEMDSTTMEETTSPTTEMNSTTMEETTSPTTEMDSTTMEETTSPTIAMNTTLEQTTESTAAPTTQTTEMPVELCPTGADTVTQCPYVGLGRLVYHLSGSSKLDFCHVIYAKAVVNGQEKQTLLTSHHCTQTIETVRALLMIQLELGDKVIDVTFPEFSLIEGPDGFAYLEAEAEGVVDQVQGAVACQMATCSVQEDISVQVDYGRCYVLISDPDKDSLKEVDLQKFTVTVNPFGCSDVPVKEWMGNTVCFSILQPGFSLSPVHSGAPVYCYGRSSKDTVLIGLVSEADQKDSERDFWVLRYPL